jgi:hypothetical protein
MSSMAKFAIPWLLVVAGCSAGPFSPTTDPTLKVGESSAYSLYTHCGILSITANGHTYYAQPPLSDGSGNPPPGWGNPVDEGTVKMISEHVIEFHDAAGHKASFTDTPLGATPNVPICS